MNVTRRCVVSTVGTSLLTNQADAGQRLALRDTANLTEAAVNGTQRALLDALAERLAKTLREADLASIRASSAELNGWYGLYSGLPTSTGHDAQFFLATDTAQRRLAARILAEHLHQRGAGHAQLIVPPGFSTASQSAFADGVRWLIRWCEETLPGYRQAGYRVVFNLSGGFKSMQAYMNTIGMIHADEIIYIFEGPSAELLRIPRLPLRFDVGLLADQRELFALLADGWLVAPERLRDWPEALWEDDGRGSATLSPWGILAWGHEKHALLAERLLNLPGLSPSAAFAKDFDGHANTEQRVQLQEALAKVAHLLLEHGGDTAALKRDPGLQYDNYTGKYADVGHFRVSRSLRVSCSRVPGGLRLLRFGKEEEVNARPR